MLLARADSANPSILAARERVAVARSRIRPASTWDDPVLMAGIQNLPLRTMKAENMGTGGDGIRSLPGDDMTMKMIGVEQTIPYPGKLALRRRIAEREADAANAAVNAVRRGVARDIKKMFFELAYLDHAAAVVSRNQAVLVDIIRVTEAHYSSGLSGQQDVLKARVEASRSGETASALIERRRSVLAELNALLDRESTDSIYAPEIPDRISTAAIPDDASRIRFVSQTLGSRVFDSAILPVEVLQELAVANNASLRQNESRLAAQSARVDLAQKAFKPDVGLSLQYGQRNQRPDMISAVVSLSIPLHKRARQDNEVVEARAERNAMQLELKTEANKVRAEVVRLVGEAERSRTQLALYKKAVLPQAEAAVMSSLAAYQSGKGDLLSVLDNQSTLFAYRIANYRSISDFAIALADLEEVVGTEVLR